MFLINVINSLLIVNSFKIVKSRDCSPETKNRKQIVFEIFINRESFQFKKMKMKMTIKNVNVEITQNIYEIDLTFDQN